MATITVSVFSPFTALQLGLDCYCSTGCCTCGNNCNLPCNAGCTHNSGFSSLGFCCPIDIGGSSYISAGTPIRFYSSTTIGSISTQRRSGFCASPGPGSPWDDAVIVNLFRKTNQQCFIGSFFYGHVANRISDGVYNSPNGLQIGTVPNCCPASCYYGVHTHMGKDSAGVRTAATCCSIMYANSTWFYHWQYNDGSC